MTLFFNDPDDDLPDEDEETEDDQGDYEEIEEELNSSIYPESK